MIQKFSTGNPVAGECNKKQEKTLALFCGLCMILLVAKNSAMNW
jgi:hypothetical protein